MATTKDRGRNVAEPQMLLAATTVAAPVYTPSRDEWIVSVNAGIDVRRALDEAYALLDCAAALMDLVPSLDDPLGKDAVATGAGYLNMVARAVVGSAQGSLAQWRPARGMAER